MRLFDINIHRLTRLVLPTALRRPLVLAFEKAVAAPVASILRRFQSRRTELLNLLKYDASTYNIERYLNKTFADGGTSIYITNVVGWEAAYLTQYTPFFLYDPNAYGPIDRAFLTTYLTAYLDAEEKTADFVVHIPQSLGHKTEDIRASVENLCLPSYTFDIVEY